MLCQKCGTINLDEANFCQSCGIRIQNNAQSNSLRNNLESESGLSKYAGFWLRFAAYLLDYIFIYIASFIIGFIIGFIIAISTGISDEDTLELILTIISLILVWLYFALMESSSLQGTLGKRLVGIKVTDIHSNRISFKRATGRFFGKFISAVIILIGFIMAGFTKKKQSLHDMMAGCFVVKK
ncbi:RDD family protein [Gottfriedia acidiceleris]|uniref:RDD family protein n=1 Tax=Gottfriedia acidiceleris TaxID=371036 RepID=UPI003D1CBC8A